MSKYIDSEELDEDVEKLNEYMKEELGIKSYRDTVILLKRALKIIEPKEKTVKPEQMDYGG